MRNLFHKRYAGIFEFLLPPFYFVKRMRTEQLSRTGQLFCFCDIALQAGQKLV